MTHKMTTCPNCDKVISHCNKARHMKSGQSQGPKFQCDQCGETTKTARGLNSHKIEFYQAPCVKNETVFNCFLNFGCTFCLCYSEFAIRMLFKMQWLIKLIYNIRMIHHKKYVNCKRIRSSKNAVLWKV